MKDKSIIRVFGDGRSDLKDLAFLNCSLRESGEAGH